MNINKPPFIISIGNIALGGTGKTPFTIFTALHYLNSGYKVCILSLGYKGKLGYSTNIISDGSTIFFKPPLAADEPYMMAERLPGVSIVTGKERSKSYRLAREKFGSNLFIMDDGFQHRLMKRDVDILLLDHSNPISTGIIFPFGYLRQMPSAIRKADIIVFTRANSTVIPDNCKKYCEGKKVFFADTFVTGLKNGSYIHDIKDLVGKKVYLMSAIAKPSKFEESLNGYNIEVIKHFKFSDHHEYSASEIESILLIANNIPIITTEKDYVKIPDIYKSHFYSLQVEIRILNEGFFETLETYREKE